MKLTIEEAEEQPVRIYLSRDVDGIMVCAQKGREKQVLLTIREIGDCELSVLARTVAEDMGFEMDEDNQILVVPR